MIKNASSNLTSIISSNNADTNRKLDAITKWIQDCPYTWGEDSPENTVYADIGAIYTDKKNGKIYKKLNNNGENNGWVELEESERIGFIKIWGSSQIPTNYKICDGSAISRVTYSILFNLIGTTFGSGDGASTFNLPDLRSAVPRGVGTSTKFTYNSTITLGQVKDDTIQGHGHSVSDPGHNHPTGANEGSDPNGWGRETHAGFAYASYSGSVLTNNTGGRTTGITVTSPSTYSYGTPRIDNETTCKAIGMHYIIKIL
jgi:microcystin-dependent protein